MSDNKPKKKQKNQSYDSKFFIQIDNRIIRSDKIDDVSFFLYCKLIQHYRYFHGKKEILEFDHQHLQYLTGIKSNKKLKECLQCLYQMKLIKTEINELPKYDTLKIEINTYFDKNKHEEKNKRRKEKGKKVKEWKDFYYTQLPCELLDVKILKFIKHTGVRLMYYYKSYVGKTTVYKNFAFPSFKRIRKELGYANGTIEKYNEILRKFKFLKVEKHQLKGTGEYFLDEFNLPVEVKAKFNNHYYILTEEIVPLLNKLNEKEV